MDQLTFWIVFIFAAITFYRLWSRRAVTPKARVTAMLRRCRALERSGLTEQEALLRLLETRWEWKNLPNRYLLAVVSRLQTKEDVLRFVSVSEEYGYLREHYPAIAAKSDLETAMTEVACLFANFGCRLQTERRFKEAEFVQRLAIRLQPDQYFTNLPLAATYWETGRHEDALPLFERGFAHFEAGAGAAGDSGSLMSLARCLGTDAEIGKVRKRYRKMYEECRRTLQSRSMPAVYAWIITELLC